MIPNDETVTKMIAESVEKGETLEQLVQKLDKTFTVQAYVEDFEKHYAEGFESGLYGNEQPDFLTVLAGAMDQPIQAFKSLYWKEPVMKWVAACSDYIDEHTVEGEIEVIEEEEPLHISFDFNNEPAKTAYISFPPGGFVNHNQNFENREPSEFIVPANPAQVSKNLDGKGRPKIHREQDPYCFKLAGDPMPIENNYVLPEEQEHYEQDLKEWRIRHNLDIDQAAAEVASILHQAGIDREQEALELFESYVPPFPCIEEDCKEQCSYCKENLQRPLKLDL